VAHAELKLVRACVALVRADELAVARVFLEEPSGGRVALEEDVVEAVFLVCEGSRGKEERKKKIKKKGKKR
jgi:hypothetical protein